MWSIVRYSKKNLKKQHFGNWICLCPEVRRRDTYSLGPLRKSKPQSLDNPWEIHYSLVFGI
jgi:hypothetical protein